jgi:hypothetical protein
MQITPTKVVEIEQFAECLEEDLKAAPTPLRTAFGHFIKGAMARVHSGAWAEHELEHTQAAQQARAAREKASRRQVQKGGVIYAKEARKRIDARTAKELQASLYKPTKKDELAKRRLFRRLSSIPSAASAWWARVYNINHLEFPEDR